MPEEIEFFANRRPDKTYLSKSFRDAWEDGRKMRFLWKVFDPPELHCFAELKREWVLSVTHGERYEIKALFYEDSREIRSITIQRFTIKSGKPHKSSFTFDGDQVAKILDVLRAVRYFDLSQEEKQRIDDRSLDELLVSVDEKKRFLRQNPQLVLDLLNNDLTQADIVALAYRKRQLEVFDNLLHEPGFFAERQRQWRKRGKEAVWQEFFEQNPWIFGYGLNYVFTTGFDDKKLEQVTSGYSVNQAGKRVDAFLRTRGLISSLCFVEIKTHETNLLENLPEPYRPDCWRVSSELMGSVAQIQKTVHNAMAGIKSRFDMHTRVGDPTGETAFLYQPKSFVVIGSLSEFVTARGINESRFGSFQLFRRNLVNPEIITFDELFERAKHIVKNSEEEMAGLDIVPEPPQDNDYDPSFPDDEILF